jgi:hypothetical protein
MRERANLAPSTYGESDDSTVTITNGVPTATLTPTPAPLQQLQHQHQPSGWIPRTFGFGENGFFQNAVAMKQHMQQYLEGYELAGF